MMSTERSHLGFGQTSLDVLDRFRIPMKLVHFLLLPRPAVQAAVSQRLLLLLCLSRLRRQTKRDGPAHIILHGWKSKHASRFQCVRSLPQIIWFNTEIKWCK